MTDGNGSGITDWDDPKWDAPEPHRLQRGVLVLLLVIVAAAVGFVGRWVHDRHPRHPGGTPPMVSQRSKLPSCGQYRAWWGMTLPPPSYRPSASVLTANRCLTDAFNEGRPAELTVTGGPDDVGHTGKSFYRVVAPHTLEVISEDIPPHGRIEAAKESDCSTLTNENGRISATDCHPALPTYG